MDRRFWLISYPGLPSDTLHAIDPQICLCGTGTGTIEARDAGLLDLGVPLLNRGGVPPARGTEAPGPLRRRGL